MDSVLNFLKQDQGSKAPSGHSSFDPCLPFYQSYLSIISFAPSTFITYLPFCQSYLSILSFAPSTFIPYLPFYQSYLSILPFAPSHISYIIYLNIPQYTEIYPYDAVYSHGSILWTNSDFLNLFFCHLCLFSQLLSFIFINIGGISNKIYHFFLFFPVFGKQIVLKKIFDFFEKI